MVADYSEKCAQIGADTRPQASKIVVLAGQMRQPSSKIAPERTSPKDGLTRGNIGILSTGQNSFGKHLG